jgi:hypothetical protein
LPVRPGRDFHVPIAAPPKSAMSESEAPRFKRRNISAAIAADVKGFVVIDDESGRLLDASDCAWRRATPRHDVLSRRADSVN